MLAGTAPFRYTVRFPAPVTHYAEVEAEFPLETANGGMVELFMAVWTPGSYLVREYARQIEDLEAFDPAAKPLRVRKTRKNRWVVEANGASSVKVTYRVYCREMSVRTNWVDERFAMLQGAATYLSVAGQLSRPHEVTLVLPDDWAKSMTGLPKAPGAQPHHYVAQDYDMLVDSPILAGNPSVYAFSVDGKEHFLVNEGEEGLWDAPRAVADLEKLVRQNLSLWGSLPYDKYLFLNVIGEGGGGLEHKNSCCLISSRYATRTQESHVGWLELASHEYFHVWNVKRLRPVELGPFDYESENYTRGLWVSEGFTEYYGGLMVRRAGLTTRDEYLVGAGKDPGASGLSGLIEKLQTTPGRLTQPVEISSYDAWIKAYRPDENSGNTSISYYTKGAVIAFLLDARIRAATGGEKSLDDAMRLAYARYAGAAGFTGEDFLSTVRDIADVDLKEWIGSVLETTSELDYTEALGYFGLRFKGPEPPKPGAAVKAWLGFTTKVDNGRLLIKQVPRGTPAFDAGFAVDDEILAIGELRVLPDQWAQRMEQFHPGERISLLAARQERLIRIEASLAEDPGRKWTLEVMPDATPEQTRHLHGWLGIF
jgi:predicted metalloprotease with PDZ domain